MFVRTKITSTDEFPMNALPHSPCGIFIHHHNMCRFDLSAPRPSGALLAVLGMGSMQDLANELRRIPLLKLFGNSG
jgi:hypothetical protein